MFDVDNLWIYGKNKQYETKFKDNTINSIPVISGITANNGVNYWTKDVLKDSEIFKDSLTISTRGEYSGTVTYHTGIFALANNILVMQMPNWSFESKLYIGTLIQKLGYGGFNNYPRKETLKDDIISLPVLPSCNENKFEIAFEYMESYIKELEAERLEELEAYLLATGLKDYKLTEQEKVILQDFAKLQDENSKRGGAFSSLDSIKNLEDYLLYGGSILDSNKQNFINHALSCLTQKALKSLDTSKWAEFRIGDLFDVVSLKKLNPLDSREFRVKETDKKHPIPAIVAKVGNNGVMYYVGKNDYETAQNKIVIIGDGAVASGLVYYHEKEFTILHNAYAIELKQKEFAKKENYLFLATAIQKSIFEVFNYELKPTWNKVKQECISLPVLPDNNIAFEYMESFIKEIEKEHFLSLIEYYHKLMNAYNEVLDSSLATNGGGGIKL